MLAKVKVQSLGPDVLDSLVKKAKESIGHYLADCLEIRVDQSHTVAEGSIEEKVERIHLAFFGWAADPATREQHGFSLAYGTILAVYDDHLIACRRDWCDFGSYEWQYYRVDFSENGGTVEMNSDSLKRVDVVMVVKELDVQAKPVQAETPSAETPITEKTMPTDEQKQAQTDPVADESTIANDALSAGGGHSASAGKDDGETAADAPGAGVEDVSDDAKAKTDSEHSTPAPKAAGDHGSESEVTAALGKTTAGLKQEDAQDEEAKPELIQGNAFDAHKQSMSYIESSTLEEQSKGGAKLMRIKGIATKADIVNSQGVVYPLSVWEKNLEQMNQAAENGKFFGKVEHPDTELGLTDVAIKFDKFWMQGSDVCFEATIPQTQDGKNLQAMIEAGVQIDMSSRGYGTHKQGKFRGQSVKIIQDDFKCTAFDAVWHGASHGSKVTEAKVQSDEPTQQGDTPVSQKELTPAEKKANEMRDEALIQTARDSAALRAAGSLSDIGMNAYKQALKKANTFEELAAIEQDSLPIFQSSFPAPEDKPDADQTQSETYSPTFFVKQSKEELAPQTPGELIDRLVADLPDHYEGQSAKDCPDTHFVSPRKACRRLLQNIARDSYAGFHGPSAIMALLALEQGKVSRAEDILTQSLPTGGTVAAANADGDGAPLSAPLIFPLIRRVFPRYIMGEIASIQPMDRPDGKIFYLDHYRTQDPASEKRIDLNTSASPFNSSYADNATEGAAAKIIRLRLQSTSVSAHTKKLGAAWSVEEMQDLRAYHGLDAAQELLGGVAREMALEWNKEVLDDMLAQGTAAALTFNTGMPATGFSQIEWDAYLWNYIQKLDNEVFGHRNGPITHIIVGMDAAMALAKANRGSMSIGDQNGDMDIYPGLTFFPITTAPDGSRYRVLKTNFWPAGTDSGKKILGLRRGSEWSDTAYIWAPYTDYVTPMLTDPADFTQKQGIVSRAAKKVVVPEAMGTVTIASGTGQLI